MGLIHRGIPEAIALKIKKKFNLDYFVETGTHAGKTALWASNHFWKVHTIELYKKYVIQSIEVLVNKTNVLIHHNNSGEILGFVLDAFIPESECALIWLDAHWSRDLKEKKPEFGECPVIEEIKRINEDGRTHVIMIDDARLFTNPPPKPHNPKHWPTYLEIVAELQNGNHKREIQIVEDVILVQPVIEND